MRRAKSYSIIDHAFLHGGYFHRLSHQALSLYLFLVVVSDRDGKSYYSERTIADILRLEGDAFRGARQELLESGLISFSSPYFWVKNISETTEPSASKERQNDQNRLTELLRQLDKLKGSE